MKSLEISFKKENKNSNIFILLANVIAICITLYYFLPIASYYIRGMYMDAVFVAWIFLVLVGSHGKFNKKLMLNIVFLIVFSACIAIMNLLSFGTITIENITIYIHFFIPIYFFLYYFNEKPKFLIKLVVVALVTLAFTSITTLIQLKNNFYISKLLTAQLQENTELLLTNVANINTMHSFIIICPLLFVLFASNRYKIKWRIVFGGLFGLFFWTSFRASFSIIMIIILLGSILMFIRDKKNILILCLIFSLLLILKQDIAQYLYHISVNFNELYAQRIREIALVMLGNEAQGDLQSRLTLYSKSIEVFFSKPFFGIANGQYFNEVFAFGGHSEWLDTLAKFGVCLGLPLFWVLFKVSRNVVKHTKRFGFARETHVCFLCFLIYGFLNPVLTFPVSMALFVILPSLAIISNRIGDNCENINNIMG